MRQKAGTLGGSPHRSWPSEASRAAVVLRDAAIGRQHRSFPAISARPPTVERPADAGTVVDGCASGGPGHTPARVGRCFPVTALRSLAVPVGRVGYPPDSERVPQH